MKARTVKSRKTTTEIRQLLKDANLDYEATVNEALNAYLPRIFLSCPFTDDLCINKKHCIECDSRLKLSITGLH